MNKIKKKETELRHRERDELFMNRVYIFIERLSQVSVFWKRVNLDFFFDRHTE